MTELATMTLPGIGQVPLSNEQGEQYYLPGTDLQDLDTDEIKVNTLIGILQSTLYNQLGLDSSNIQLYTQKEVGIYDDPFEYYSINFYGGLNGPGMWSSYFETLSGMMAELEQIFEDAWVIALDVDCSDDVFYLTLGIKPYENQLS